MTIPSQQPERWLKQAREIAHKLKTDPRVPDKNPLNIGIAFDDSIVNLTLDRGTIERLDTQELAGLIFGLVLQDRTAAPQAPCTARSDSPEDAVTSGAPTPAADQPPPVGQPGQSTGGEHRLPAQPAAAAVSERCAVNDTGEQCPNDAAGGLRVNLYATQTIQKRYGRRSMLSLIFDLPICLACLPKVTPANVMTDEQWRAFSKAAQQRNSGILADRAQTEILLCPFEDPEYVHLRERIAKQAANDSQPAPAGPQPEGAGDGQRSESGA